ncbi:glycosyl transferase family 90-domain-containing protein, partial [Roridomyces roridus]
MRTFRVPIRWRLLAALFAISILPLLVRLAGTNKRKSSASAPPQTSPTPVLFVDPTAAEAIAYAHSRLDALLAQQSTTLSEAVARYTLKAGRNPPPNFAQWFDFARENDCLIDEYDQIQKDFEPFYQLALHKPTQFQSMINQRHDELIKETLELLSPKRQSALGMTAIGIKDGKMQLPPYRGTWYHSDLAVRLRRFQHFLPDLEFLLNGRDEPRVVFDVRELDAHERALEPPKDSRPFHNVPNRTDIFFRNHSGCDLLSSGNGFATDISADVPCKNVSLLFTPMIHNFLVLLSSSSTYFTTDLWPLLSMAKISPCFSDILFPSLYYYTGRWSPRLKPNDILWSDKKTQIYWRGASNGGHIIGENYRSFPRFRLIELAREFPDLINAEMTSFPGDHCTNDQCDRERIIKIYNISGPIAPKDDVLQFKYLLDVDGNTFSGRFLNLLKSGSLVFKATAFVEYFDDWLRPYEHYIPLKPDLSDLVDKVRWAIANEAEARRILETGKLFAERVITDKQNDCYFSAVLLEWGRV